jgi:hypothetical protein
VKRQPRAFFALDFGSATTSAALIGRVGTHWRLVAHAAAPASIPLDLQLCDLLDKVQVADADLLASLTSGSDLDGQVDTAALASTLPRLEARSSPPRRIAVLAGSRRQRIQLEAAATRAGWLVVSGSADEDDPVTLSRLALSPNVAAVLLGADHSPSGDERRHLPMLAALVAAADRCRSELTVVLAGGAGVHEAAFPEAYGRAVVALPGGSSSTSAASDTADDETEDEDETGTSTTRTPASGPRSHNVLIAPDAAAGEPAGGALQQVLEGLRAVPNDSRLGFARSISSLASVLDRSIEGIEIGLQGGLRCRAERLTAGSKTIVSWHAAPASASFAPPDPDDGTIEGLVAWSPVALDRYRVTDRLRDLRIFPWGDADGDGSVLRTAAAKAATERAILATRDISARPMPDLIVAGGGTWASMPAALAALALADLVRRPGVSRLAVDHARLLGPLGAIEDEDERCQMLSDLADDLLVPLGTVIMPTGMHQGRSAGKVTVRPGEPAPGAEAGRTIAVQPIELDMQPGSLELIELAPGKTATARMEFRDNVRLTSRGRSFTVDVDGGLVGLLVDLREVPLRTSERSEARRAALEAWQKVVSAETNE